MDKLLSIVVPVYGVEPYIRQCLDSLLVPEGRRPLLDVVVVNDGTLDRSAEIAREYEAEYPDTFRVVDQENRGHGGAWNRGTELAAGKYLYYLDSDDWFDTDELSRLMDYLQTVDVDMVLTNSTVHYILKGWTERTSLKNMEPGVVYDANTYDWLHCGNGSNITYAHGTVYRTAMMKRYHPIFTEQVLYDDIILQVMPIMSAESFVYQPFNVYQYRKGRPGQSYDPVVWKQRRGEVTVVVKDLLRFIEEHIAETPEASTRRAWAEEYYTRFCSHHYLELLRFPYRESRERLADWDSFIGKKCKETDLSWSARIYRSVCFPVYYYGIRSYSYLGKKLRTVKRKIACCHG